MKKDRHCVVCHESADMHHAKRRGIGSREDEPDEKLIPLCRLHHVIAHALGPVRFLALYGVLTCTQERLQVLKERQLA